MIHVPLAAKAALGLGALALLFLGGKKGSSPAPQPAPGPGPNPAPAPAPGPGRKTRPDPFPPDAGEARVNVDLNTRTGPGTGHPIIPLNDAFAGTTVAVFSRGAPGDDGEPGEWWGIMTPGGGVGWAKGIGTPNANGLPNLSLITPPAADQPPPIAGIAGIGCDPGNMPRPFAGYPRSNIGALLPTPAPQVRRMSRVRCVSPAGCWLRPSPGAAGQVHLSVGTPVTVLRYVPGQKLDASSSGPGGWALVQASVNGRTVQGWALSETFSLYPPQAQRAG